MFGLMRKAKQNLINTLSFAPKVFGSNNSFACGIVLRRLEKKKSWDCLFEKMKRKFQLQRKYA
jgi:hypothetical protein